MAEEKNNHSNLAAKSAQAANTVRGAVKTGKAIAGAAKGAAAGGLGLLGQFGGRSVEQVPFAVLEIEDHGVQSGGFGGGNGSDDVKLQYIDDDADSYPNIFDNAKTDVSGKDEKRLIESIRKLSSYEDLEDVLDMDAVLRYFVVHNFVVNGDSYTGSMIHNYYLYEQDGKLSMLPWDYNLAFGGFQGSDAESAVNDPIDDVLSDRPMQAWIFSSEEYTELYHEYYEEFLQSADIDGLIDEAYSLIAPYVEKDPTKFCTYDEFETGVQTLKTFCSLRAQSVMGQLDGSIPSTSEARKENSESLVDASAITISDMGSIGNTMGGKGGFGGRQNDDADKSDAADTEGFTPSQRPDSSADAGTDFEADTQGGPPQSPPDGQNGTSPGQTDGQGSSRTSGTQTVLLAACALVLALGLGFAVFYKRR